MALTARALKVVCDLGRQCHMEGEREEGGGRGEGEGREGVSLGDGWLSGAVHLCTNGVEATNEDSTSLTTNLTIEARRSSTV